MPLHGLNWSGRAVLVAGGAGFVGSALLRLLADDGARVVSLDDYSTGCPCNVPGHPGVEAVRGDARDEPGVVRLMREHGTEFVFHCIGDTFVPEAYEFPGRFFDVNVGTTLSILRAARETRVRRVLYVSSTEVYGETSTEYADESCDLLPLNTYAVSKLAADRLCHTYHLEHGLPVIVARIFNCYGPRATHPYIIPEIIRQLHEGPPLRLGNVDAERDFTYVEDTARALAAVMASNLPDGDVVNVGSGHAHSVASLVTRLARIMGVTDAGVELDPSRLRRHDIHRFCSDSGKLRRATGWEPCVSLDAGLARTVEWFRENGCRWSWMG
jgi:nucleoside-diphosphate-sugar epimerase